MPTSATTTQNKYSPSCQHIREIVENLLLGKVACYMVSLFLPKAEVGTRPRHSWMISFPMNASDLHLLTGVNILVKICMVASAMCKIQSTRRSRDALLATKQRVECFILCIARARPCFNCFKNLHMNGYS